ncbi:MAG: HEPN domain-containing protein [Nitrospirae bacterium]|nr:HEPN domain-containing protein [Nitrospirota bacterium]
MGNRHGDWLRQAEADLRHARHAIETQDFEWSCFAAHQAAEKAIEAVLHRNGIDAWGHTLTTLLGGLPSPGRPDEALLNRAKMLDKHYIPSRYPNGFESGAPNDFYTREEAVVAVAAAEAILGFCRIQVG